jgi:membrane-bound ClpP family serine protease
MLRKINNLFIIFPLFSYRRLISRCYPDIIYCRNMNKKLTLTRLVLAIVSMALEQLAIWTIWRWLLPEFGVKLHLFVLIGAMVAWAVFGTWLFIFTTRILKKQPLVGLPSMVGARGKAVGRLAPDGMVRIRGELWGATSVAGNIDAGEDIVVISEDGLKLLVRRVGDTGSTR